VRVETVTYHGNVYPDGFTDPTINEIYRGVTERGPGPHLLTGPIAVDGAEPGDSLEVRVLALEPRLPFGLTAQLPGFLLKPDPEEATVGTVWAIDATLGRAKAMFRFTYPVPRPAAEVPLRPEREPALRGISVPLRPHLGVSGLASAVNGRVSTRAPGRFGGNMDQWRFGASTTMTYPVLVSGGLFSCGDAHLAQGDGEICATAIESHLTATLQFTVRKGMEVGFPRLETPGAWVLQAFAPTLDEAWKLAAYEALAFLESRGVDRVDAYTLLSVAADFGITQVVDQQLGVHVLVSKSLFVGD
jgi:acetamidase/formamidase